MGTLPPLTPPPPAPSPGAPRRRARIAGLLIPALVGAAAALLVTRLGDEDPAGNGTVTIIRETPAASAPAPTPANPAEGASSLSVQQIVRDASPGVVLVEHSRGLGSGFLIEGNRHILTNAHVVDNAGTVTVTYADGTTQEAKVLASDDAIDLAVLDIGKAPPSAKALPIGRSASLVVGDAVVAIGNPLGFERTATTGIVSALKRQICSPDDSVIANAIQTDAAINQGNSGGPLLDARGRVIGINSQIVSQGGGFEGIGFAVPIDTVRPVADAIIAGRGPEHAWIGIVGEPLTPDLAQQIGVGEARGVVLRTVDPRGPAKAAGLRGSNAARDEPPEGGDIIVEIAGKPIRDFGDLSQEIGARRVGEKVDVTVLRDGKRITLALTLADRPDDLGGTCQ